MLSFYLLTACFAGIVSVQGQSTFTPARPPALPLAVKSPYLNTWLNAGTDGGNGGYLAGQWPVHWRSVLPALPFDVARRSLLHTATKPLAGLA